MRKVSPSIKSRVVTVFITGLLPPSEKIKAQCVVGTPSTVKRWILMHKVLDPTHIKTVVVDGADDIFAKDGYMDDLPRIMKYVKTKQSVIPKRQQDSKYCFSLQLSPIE